MSNIIFSGDSFTWGEGLDLYINEEPWISQRNKKSWYDQLHPMRTPASDLFREKNRFPNIVSNHFNHTALVHEDNGGDFISLVRFVETNLDKDIEFIVLQFTMIHRMFFSFEESYNKVFNNGSNCEFTNKCDIQIFDFYYYILNKIIDNIPMHKEDYDLVNILNTKHGLPLMSELYKMTHPGDILDILKPIYESNIDYIYKTFIKKWKEKYKILIIDSWDGEDTSSILLNHPDINELLVPLKGYDGNYYVKYSEWEKTFPYTRIQHQFPKTENGHPTLLQHKYLAESIIEKIEKDNG